MDDYEDRYGSRFIKLIDSRVTGKEFKFYQMLIMPTAESCRAEILSIFAMAVSVYARSTSDQPYSIDVGKALLKTIAFCNLRCARRKESGSGCLMASCREQHYSPKYVNALSCQEILPLAGDMLRGTSRQVEPFVLNGPSAFTRAWKLKSRSDLALPRHRPADNGSIYSLSH